MSDIELKRLVQILLSYCPDHKWILEKEHSLKNRFRALENLHDNLETPLTDEFIRLEASYLNDKLYSEGVVSAFTLPSTSYPKIALTKVPPYLIQADAVVNPTNPELTGDLAPLNKSLDNLIHSYAGLRLRYECHQVIKKRKKNLEVSEALVTNGYNLPSKYVIHIVGPRPIHDNITFLYEKKLEQCYINALDRATSLGMKAIVFPSISTGEERFPRKSAVEIAIREVDFYLATHDNAPAVVFAPSDEDYPLYEEKLQD
ncbi:MAG: macro domain-containing protein [Bacilli bacterium]|nr:macro domain-containing protein [Bacilli bacterium]